MYIKDILRARRQSGGWPLSAGLSPPSSRSRRGSDRVRYLATSSGSGRSGSPRDHGQYRRASTVRRGGAELPRRSRPRITLAPSLSSPHCSRGRWASVIETEIMPWAISRADAVTRFRCARHYRHTPRRRRGRAELDDYDGGCATFTGEAVRTEPNRSSDPGSYAFRHQITPKCRSASSIASRFSCGHGTTSRSWRARSASRSVAMP
jgi:hypothetical protein